MKKKKKENIFKRIGSKFKIEDERFKKIIGFLLVFFSLYLVVVFISFLINGNIDQDKLGKFSDDISNFGGVFGHRISNLFLYNWFGISSFIFLFLLFNWGVFLVFDKKIMGITKSFSLGILSIAWISLFFGFFTSPSILGGVFGSEMNSYLELLIGKIGTGFVIFLSLLTFVILRFNPKFKSSVDVEIESDTAINEELEENEPLVLTETEVQEEEEELTVVQSEEKVELITDTVVATPKAENKDAESDDLDIEVHVNEEETLSQKDISNKLEELGEYDPKLDLSNYKIPKINLLEEYGSGKIEIDKTELEANKNRIVETLGNYKIGISSISATIGPTITLYEIVPEAGVRISKIKNLEDDIALSLSALGIRIIAPIPGRGTIGIEVPNQNPATVSMKAVISSDKFQKN